MVVVNFILQKRLPFLYGFFHLHKIFYTLFKVVNQNDFSSYFQTYCQQLVIKIVKEYHSQPFDSETEYKLFINYHSQAIAGTIKQSLTLSDQDYQKQALLLIQLIKKNIEN